MVTAIAAKKTMKAIIQDGYGSADVLRLQEIDKPVVADFGLALKEEGETEMSGGPSVVATGTFESGEGFPSSSKALIAK